MANFYVALSITEKLAIETFFGCHQTFIEKYTELLESSLTFFTTSDLIEIDDSQRKFQQIIISSYNKDSLHRLYYLL